MQKRQKNEEEDESEIKKNTGWAYNIGLLIGTALVIFISNIAWNIIAPEFGITKLNFIQFFSLTWLAVFFSRMLRLHGKT
jgi:hypothetical protein